MSPKITEKMLGWGSSGIKFMGIGHSYAIYIYYMPLLISLSQLLSASLAACCLI